MSELSQENHKDANGLNGATGTAGEGAKSPSQGATSGASATGGRVRSGVPYPFHPLSEAIRVAEAIQRAGGSEAHEDEVLKQLGLENKEARAWTYRLSSAREFGLAARTGRGNEAKIKVTDLAKRILLPTGADELIAAKLQAFQEPVLYQKLISRFSGAPMPELKGLANLLKREFGILANVVDAAAAAFIDTAREVGAVNPANYLILTSSPTAVKASPASSVSSPPEPVMEPQTSDLSKPANGATQTVTVPSSFITHTFQLRRELEVRLPLPRDLTSKDVKRLHKWLQTLPIEDDETEPNEEAR